MKKITIDTAMRKGVAVAFLCLATLAAGSPSAHALSLTNMVVVESPDWEAPTDVYQMNVSSGEIQIWSEARRLENNSWRFSYEVSNFGILVPDNDGFIDSLVGIDGLTIRFNTTGLMFQHFVDPPVFHQHDPSLAPGVVVFDMSDGSYRVNFEEYVPSGDSAAWVHDVEMDALVWRGIYDPATYPFLTTAYFSFVVDNASAMEVMGSLDAYWGKYAAAGLSPYPINLGTDHTRFEDIPLLAPKALPPPLAATPEPSTGGLALLGLAGFLMNRWLSHRDFLSQRRS